MQFGVYSRGEPCAIHYMSKEEYSLEGKRKLEGIRNSPWLFIGRVLDREEEESLLLVDSAIFADYERSFF